MDQVPPLRSEHKAQDVQVTPFWVGKLRAIIVLEAAARRGAKVRKRMKSGGKILRKAQDWLVDNLQYRLEGKAELPGERELYNLLQDEIERAERIAAQTRPQPWPIPIPGAEKAEAQEWCPIIAIAFWERTYGYPPGIHLPGVQELCQRLWQETGGETGRKKRTYSGKAPGLRRWEKWLSRAQRYPGLVQIVHDHPAGWQRKRAAKPSFSAASVIPK
jgi:hypothetical protein